MTIARLSRPFALALLALVTVLVLGDDTTAQRSSGSVRAWEHETSDVPVDPRIEFGQLANGMRFAWAVNTEPNKRCYVRLHVDVGSFAEEEHEAGMAHFLEHMAFNGSDNFEPDSLIEWFQNHGMGFGNDTNAYTAFSETVYQLDLPTSDAATLESGLVVLSDFAYRLTMSDEEVEKEKGVIDGEQRERDSPGFRVFLEQLEKLYGGTRYPDRLPIGTKQARDAFTGDSVRAFYRRWYRPENMTLVIVGDLGDLDPTPLIEEAFGAWEAPSDVVPAEPAKGTPTLAEEDRVFFVTEPEIAAVSLTVERLRPYEDEPFTQAEWIEELPLRYARRMLNLRLSEMLKLPDTPFLGAGVGAAGGLEIFEGATLNVSAEPGRWTEALIAANVELRKALAFGFQQPELDEMIADSLRSLDEAVERERTRDSRRLLGEILGAAESRVVPTTAETDRSILRPAIAALTVEACHEALVKDWSEGTQVIYGAGNLDLGVAAELRLQAAFDASMKAPIEAAKKIEVVPFAYASDSERSGPIVEQEHDADLDLHTVTFANGVKLNLKVTDFKERQILISARLAEGGLTLTTDEHTVGWVGGDIFDMGGLGAHTEEELRRITAGKQVGMGFGMSEDHFSLSGNTTEEDLLLQFELMCAYLTDPGWRDDGLTVMRQQLPLQYDQLAQLPQGPQLFEFLPALYDGDPRFVPLPALDDVMSVDMEQVRGWLEPVLAEGPLEIGVIGDLDVDAVVTAAARTFGVLPARRPIERHEDRRKAPNAKSGLRMNREIETVIPKTLVFMVFPTTDGIDTERRHHLNFLGSVLNDRLRIEVRERLGAAYSPGAGGQSSRIFPGVGSVIIQANADPEKVDTLVEACLAVAEDLAQNGVTAEEVERLSEPVLAQLRDAMRTNGFWLPALAEAQTNPQRMADAAVAEQAYRELSVERLVELAGAYLKPDRASILVVDPIAPETDG